MIQKIVKNSDIKFCVDEDSKIQDKFIIKFYTIDKAKGITRTADDVITVNDKRYIKLNWSTIKLLDNGMLNYEVNNLDSDADYDDGVYNSTFTRTTYYYLCTDSDGLADAIEEIELRVDQITTDITGLKSNNATITTQMGDLQTRMPVVETKSTSNEENITDLQNRMSSVETKSTSNEENITDLQNRMSSVETKSTSNENSINTMSNDYAALVSRLERLEANGTNKPDSLDDRVSALENSKKSLDNRIEEARQIIYHLSTNYGDSNYNTLDNDLTILESRVSTLENSTQGNNESISSVATNNDNIANRALTLENEPSALENEPSSLATDNDSLVNRVSTLENNFRGFDKRMLKVEKKTKDYVIRFPKWSSYTQISNTLGALRYRVEALENGTQGNNESISSVATNNDNIANRALTLENEPSALENEPSSLATDNDSLVNRVSTLATNNNSLDDRITVLENSIYLTDATIQNFQDFLIDFSTNWQNNSACWLYISNRLTELDMKITALETR